MASQDSHRLFAGAIILIYLHVSEYLVPEHLVLGLIIAALFGGGRPWDNHIGLSPDVDLKFFHRNPITHSTLIPLALLWIYYRSESYYPFVNNTLIFILIAWWSHVLLDLITEKDELRFDYSPKKWCGGGKTYIAVILAVIVTALLLIGIMPNKLQLLGL